MTYPKAKIETKYGTREVSVVPYVNRETAVLEQHLYVGHEDRAAQEDKFMGPIRGIEYHVAAHLYRRADGTFKIGAHADYGYNYEVLTEGAGQAEDQWKKRQENHSNLYATRAATFLGADASKSARLALGAAIEEAVNKWAKTPEAERLLASGDEDTLRGEVDRANAAVAEATTALEAAKAARRNADEALTKFLERLVEEVPVLA